MLMYQQKTANDYQSKLRNTQTPSRMRYNTNATTPGD